MKNAYTEISLLSLQFLNSKSFCGYEFSDNEFNDMVLHHDDWMNHSMDEMLTHLNAYILKRPISKFLMDNGIHAFEIIEFLKILSTFKNK